VAIGLDPRPIAEPFCLFLGMLEKDKHQTGFVLVDGLGASAARHCENINALSLEILRQHFGGIRRKDTIDKNLATAAKHHASLCEYCEKENVQAEGSMKCCQEIDGALASAIAEHDKLMKRLASAKPATK
jgi:hypothetical protein